MPRARTFPPNAWGLFDMHGNVWEWCADWYGPYPREGATDPQGAESGEYRVLRGGSFHWNSGYCRSASRYSREAEFHYNDVGCRVVLCLG